MPGLLALAGVLGIGEGHLLHRVPRAAPQCSLVPALDTR